MNCPHQNKADKAEDFVNANDDMRQQLRSVYDDACISLMTAPKSLKQKAKQRKKPLKIKTNPGFYRHAL